MYYSEGFTWFNLIVTIAAAAAAAFLLWFLLTTTNNRNNNNNNNNNNNTQSPPPHSSSAAADAQAADLLLLRGEYEVFLSFYGPDTRNGFADFLYTYLVGAGIRTFRDDNVLHVGEESDPELLRVINSSKISIPIFSKKYASSKWRLRELTQMVECQANGGQMIFPIFYDVDPSEVQRQRGSYEKAFRQYKKSLDEKTVQRWKEAPSKVGQLKGLELKKETYGHEGELVKMVIKMVLSTLKKIYTPVPNNLIGTDEHIKQMEIMESLLLLGGEYEVFLSFYGPDTRNGFTDFLYTYLVGASIRTFRDDNELRVGEEIGPDLLKAINESKISIPIFSKNYASNKWYLHELTQMVECQANGGQMIFPIFYDVDPSEVQHQRGSYEKAFRQYKKSLDEKTVQQWEKAMTIVGELKGLELKKETNG